MTKFDVNIHIQYFDWKNWIKILGPVVDSSPEFNYKIINSNTANTHFDKTSTSGGKKRLDDSFKDNCDNNEIPECNYNITTNN